MTISKEKRCSREHKERRQLSLFMTTTTCTRRARKLLQRQRIRHHDEL